MLAIASAPCAPGVPFQNITPGNLVFMLDDYFSATSYDTLPINATLGATNNPSLGAASMDGGVFNQAPGTHMIAPSPFSDGDR